MSDLRKCRTPGCPNRVEPPIQRCATCRAPTIAALFREDFLRGDATAITRQKRSRGLTREDNAAIAQILDEIRDEARP